MMDSVLPAFPYTCSKRSRKRGRAPGLMEAWVPTRTSRFLDYFFAEDADDGWIEELLAFDDEIGRQDRELVEGVQRGAGSGALFVDLTNNGRLDLYVSNCVLDNKMPVRRIPSALGSDRALPVWKPALPSR